MNEKEYESRFFDLLSQAPGKTFLFYSNLGEDSARWSDSAVQYFGLSGSIIDHAYDTWIGMIHPDDVDGYVQSFQDMIQNGSPYHNCEYRMRNAAGEYVWVNCRGYLTYDAENRPSWFAGFVTNMGQQSKIDAVTKLWTVYQFRGTINRLLDMHERGGVLLIGLENFKRINAEYGYDFGDRVLAEVAGKLLAGLRHNCTLYRMDGANFAVVMVGADKERVLEYRDYVKQIFRSLVVNGKALHLHFRSSATFFPEDGEFLDQIQSNLFYALDHAKMTNAEEVVFYSQELFVRKTQMMRLRDAIHECVEDHCRGFRIVMQPIMDSGTEKCEYAEVLLRFWHEEFGAISPVEFIPILESSKEIIKVGKWVIDEALRTLAEWCYGSPAQTIPLQKIHINISYVQLQDVTLLDYVVEKLDEYRLPHDVLVLELTESCRIEHTSFLTEVLQRFKGAGINIALDDFGTGYASLTVLKDIPADIVKLDHTMTRSIVDRPKDKALIEFIVTYSQKVGIQVCAEGVETMEALSIVKNAGADSIQGYYYDKPLELEAFYKKYIEKLHEEKIK